MTLDQITAVLIDEGYTHVLDTNAVPLGKFTIENPENYKEFRTASDRVFRAAFIEGIQKDGFVCRWAVYTPTIVVNVHRKAYGPFPILVDNHTNQPDHQQIASILKCVRRIVGESTYCYVKLRDTHAQPIDEWTDVL